MKRVDHIAIVVADMDEAIRRWQSLIGGELTSRQPAPEQGVEVAFIELGDTQVELIRPTTEDSGVARHLAKRGESLHHLALEVEDMQDEMARLGEAGVRFIDQTPRQGSHGQIAFLHPQSTAGVLIELVQRD